MRSSPGSWLRSSMRCASWFIEGALLSMQAVILAVLLVLAAAWLTGCGRAVLVPESSPFRIGPGTRAPIYTMTDGEWTLSPNAVAIPEGWYCVPPSFVED